MTKILVLANNDVGLYKFRKELLHELMRLNHIVYISLPNGVFVEKLIEIGCKYIETPIDRRGTNPIRDLKLLKKYYEIIKKIKPDVILTYTIKPNIYGGIASRITKTPYLVNITGLGTAIESAGLLQKVLLKLYKTSLKNADCIFFQNKENKDLFSKKDIVNNNSRMLPGSGVNINEFEYQDYPIDDKTIEFLYIGRIMKDKGVNELFDAAAIIKENYSNVHFNLIGDFEEDYKDKVQNLEKRGIVKYHGMQKDVRPFITKSHAIILPSYHEGTSNVLLEAASTGRPIIASNVAGCRETFNEGISGFGFKVKDPHDLVKVLLRFIKLPYENKKAMGIAGRKKMIKDYSRFIVIDAYIEEINKVLHDKD
ncbi:MAG: glycosyltransferase family 4 protein [Clostridiales bacterium]|nr:glycosyltransferase family 4 protein [Clostridiales bacterium]